jgi:phosphonate transport system ATP-binding protein
MKVALDAVTVAHPSAPAGVRPALRELTLMAAPGEHIAVVGPSGAGKTTLLLALACALRPASGQLALDDENPWALPGRDVHRLRRRLFLAPQVPPLPPRQRVITAVLAGRLAQWSLSRSLRSLLYPADIAAARVSLERFALEHKLWERVDRLSGGERQRVGLARLTLGAASLWLVDEPLSSLDPARAERALDTLTRLARERGATLIASLHQVDRAIRFPRVLGLRDGALQFDLPGAAVTRERLADLYAEHEYELAGGLPSADWTGPGASDSARRPWS